MRLLTKHRKKHNVYGIEQIASMEIETLFGSSVFIGNSCSGIFMCFVRISQSKVAAIYGVYRG